MVVTALHTLGGYRAIIAPEKSRMDILIYFSPPPSLPWR